VRGNVGGDLVTGGETVTVEGTVGGNVIGGARALALLGTGIVGNVYGGGRDVEVGGNTAVGGNAIAFGENVKIDGRVGRDLKGFGSRITIGGSVEGNVEGFAENVTLRIAPGAVIGGRTEETIGADRSEAQPNRYLTVGFYLREIVGLAAAYVTGLLLLAAFPALRSLVLPDATAVLRSGGIGLVVAIVLPIAALIACITVIGIPIGLLVFVLGAIGLYFGKTVVAQIVGTALFRGPQGVAHFAATLLAGLVIVRVAINLPIVGGIANVVLTLVGFGLIVSVLYARLQRGPLS
jgi:hypothetical protein